VALRPAFVDAHIERWQAELTSPYYPHRKHWPAHLFHHAPLENAVAILRDGHLRSRNETDGVRPRDVAAPGVIDARAHAHDRVRLYFRPKTPTQWHIEGIRKANECAYGEATHAPVLVMFALDARSVLIAPDVMFSNQNMQLCTTQPGDSEAYFSDIPFAKVFSEGGTGGDRSLTDARCAEVLPASPLGLAPVLRAIYLRSEPERDTLLHLLGNVRDRWAPFCRVSDALKVFEKNYTFVQDIRLSPEGVVFRFNHRRDRRNVAVAIRVWSSDGQQILDFLNEDHAPLPAPPHTEWIWRQKLADGIYTVEVLLENQLAYRNEVTLGSSLF